MTPPARKTVLVNRLDGSLRGKFGIRKHIHLGSLGRTNMVRSIFHYLAGMPVDSLGTAERIGRGDRQPSLDLRIGNVPEDLLVVG